MRDTFGVRDTQLLLIFIKKVTPESSLTPFVDDSKYLAHDSQKRKLAISSEQSKPIFAP